MDGGAPTPEEFRQVILREEGEWALCAVTLPSTELLKSMRKVLSLTLADVVELRGHLPGEIRRGTRSEMEWLAYAMEGRTREVLVVSPTGGA
jgi:hypothetical protein